MGAQDKYNEPDQSLLDRAKSGDHTAFTKLFRNYENLVYSFAFKVCRDREKASETLQDTFVNVFRKIHQFDRRAKFTTWLYSIVTNNCLMKKRRSKIDVASVPIDEADSPFEGRAYERVPIQRKNTPIDSLMESELRELLDAAIQKLPMAYRIVFVLRDIEGKSGEETAEILKLSVPAVKSRLRRARIFLREYLNDYMAA